MAGESLSALAEGQGLTSPTESRRAKGWAGQLIDAEIGRRAIAVKPQMEIDSLEGIALLVARGLGVSVVTGRFQAAMEVSLVNSGPVTILLDTEKLF